MRKQLKQVTVEDRFKLDNGSDIWRVDFKVSAAVRGGRQCVHIICDDGPAAAWPPWDTFVELVLAGKQTVEVI